MQQTPHLELQTAGHEHCCSMQHVCIQNGYVPRQHTHTHRAKGRPSLVIQTHKNRTRNMTSGPQYGNKFWYKSHRASSAGTAVHGCTQSSTQLLPTSMIDRHTCTWIALLTPHTHTDDGLHRTCGHAKACHWCIAAVHGPAQSCCSCATLDSSSAASGCGCTRASARVPELPTRSTFRKAATEACHAAISTCATFVPTSCVHAFFACCTNQDQSLCSSCCTFSTHLFNSMMTPAPTKAPTMTASSAIPSFGPGTYCCTQSDNRLGMPSGVQPVCTKAWCDTVSTGNLVAPCML